MYQRFREIFSSDRWKALAKRGARVQRVLWASTGTKNPAYSDVLYVESLIGPDTVNTLPPATLNAFRDHGKVRETVTEGVDQAREAVERLGKLGIDLNAITEKLQEEGVKAFSESMDKLLESLEEKRSSIVASQVDAQTLSLGPWEKLVEERLGAWQRGSFARRMWAKDYTLWSAKPVPELTDRMGWLTLPETMHAQVPALLAFADQVRDEGFRHVVLLGMGGSSLAPEVFQRTFGNARGRPELIVLDSTHPGAVRGVESQVDLEKTLFLVSSKSGTTTETSSFFHYFWQRLSQTGRPAGAALRGHHRSRFVAGEAGGGTWIPRDLLLAGRGRRTLLRAYRVRAGPGSADRGGHPPVARRRPHLRGELCLLRAGDIQRAAAAGRGHGRVGARRARQGHVPRVAIARSISPSGRSS